MRRSNLAVETAVFPLKRAGVGPATLRGRPQARSFGQPTAGVSTAASTFPLSDGATILLTTSTMSDRTGKRYGARVEPDELIAAPVEPRMARNRGCPLRSDG